MIHSDDIDLKHPTDKIAFDESSTMARSSRCFSSHAQERLNERRPQRPLAA